MIVCGRYIERNPVKAGIVQIAQEYEYSSASFYCCGIDDGLTSESPIYAGLGDCPAERQMKYREFLHDPADDNSQCWENTDNPQGDPDFIKKLIKYNGRVVGRNRGGAKGKNKVVTL